MKLKTKSTFEKDAKKLSIETQKELVLLIDKIKDSESLDVFNVKKMIGFKNFYRIRMGDYRIGVYIEEGFLVLARVAKRDEIYKIFP